MKKYYRACLKYNKSHSGADYFDKIIETREKYYEYERNFVFNKKVERYNIIWQSFPIYLQEINGKYYDVVLKKEIFMGDEKGVCFTSISEVSKEEVLKDLKKLNISAIVEYYEKMKKLQEKSVAEYYKNHPKLVKKRCKKN